MLDHRDRRGAGPKTLLGGALVLAIAGASLLYASIDWLRHGCGCDEPLLPDWVWIILMALAITSLLGSAAVAVRAARQRPTPATRPTDRSND
ncbi:MAG: hypothetical protein WEB52_11835 [Dehalococcoidia bacterium]